MKKIFLILTLFFVFCVNVCAYPSDFFKSYPNGSIEIDIKWENDELYYNSYFYNANHNKINAKQNWDDFKTNGLLDEVYNDLNKNYSYKNMTISILLNISQKNEFTMASKYYDNSNNNNLLKEIVEDGTILKHKIYDDYGNLIAESEQNEKKNIFLIKSYNKTLKSYSEIEVLFNKNEMNFKENKESLGDYVSNSYSIESHYTFKNLNKFAAAFAMCPPPKTKIFIGFFILVLNKSSSLYVLLPEVKGYSFPFISIEIPKSSFILYTKYTSLFSTDSIILSKYSNVFLLVTSMY